MSSNQVLFRHGIFECGGCGPFMGALCCTACLFGRVANRLNDYPRVPDDGDSTSCLNSDCAFMYIAQQVGLCFLPVWIKRLEHRKKFNIEGTTLNDCCTTWWCTPCAVAQQELDLKERARDNYPMVTQAPSARAEKMAYSQPQPQSGGVVTTTTVPQ